MNLNKRIIIVAVVFVSAAVEFFLPMNIVKAGASILLVCISSLIIIRLFNKNEEETVKAAADHFGDNLSKASTGSIYSVDCSRTIESIIKDYSNDGANIADGIVRDVTGILGEMQTLKGQISEVSAAVSQIITVINEFASLARMQTQSADIASASIKDMVTRIKNISDISTANMGIKESLQETVVAGRHKIRNSNTGIQKIAAEIDDVMNIINVINAIAAQTNLLAMNAAIEAAHAGSHGAGFSVVAEEIRNLAQSASVNSSSIKKNLQHVKSSTVELLSMSHESEEAFNEVSENVENFVSAFNEILEGTVAAVKGSNTIEASSEDLTAASGKISRGADEVRASADNINNSLLTIKDSYSVVNNEVGVVNSRAEEIIHTLQATIGYIDWNNNNLMDIEAGIEVLKNLEGQPVSDFINLNHELMSLIPELLEWVRITGAAIRGMVVPDETENINESEAADSENCVIGRWLKTGSDKMANHQTKNDIASEHKRFHEAIVQTSRGINSGVFENAFSSFRSVRESYTKIVSILLETVKEQRNEL